VSDRIDDHHLEHMCKLSVIAVEMILSPDYDPTHRECETGGDVHNLKNIYRILAHTFVELQQRQGIKPKFRVKVSK